MNEIQKIGIVAIIGLILLISGCVEEKTIVNTPILTSVPTVQSTTQLTDQEIKSKAITVAYDDILRDNEQYVGKIVKFRIFALQVNDLGNNKYQIIGIPLKPGTRGDSVSDIDQAKALYIWYEGKRILQYDIIDIWGDLKGIKYYENLQGAQITAPEINAQYIEMVRKASDV